MSENENENENESESESESENESAIRVSGLYVYPLKSARAISMVAMTLDVLGPCFDRRWMLVDARGRFISQREEPRLALVSTALRECSLTVSAAGHESFRIPPHDPSAPRTPSAIWDDVVDTIAIGDDADEWFSAVLESPCRLVFLPDDSLRLADHDFNPDARRVGLADGFPLLILGEESVADLNERIRARGRPAVAMSRFRPNIVFRGAEPYAEDTWRTIDVGGDDGVRLSIVKPCARCAITTVDQDTGMSGKEPLATLATYRRAADGSVLIAQNAIHDGAGVIRIDDGVRVRALGRRSPSTC